MSLICQPKSDIIVTNNSKETFPNVFDGSERFISTGIRLYGRELFFEGSCSKIIDDRKKISIIRKLINRLGLPIYNEINHDENVNQIMREYCDATDYKDETDGK